jgi:hypothetical protein
MGFARITAFLLGGCAFSLFLCQTSFADDSWQGEQNKDYSSQSQQRTDHSFQGAQKTTDDHRADIDHFRIRRDSTPRLYGRVEHDNNPPPPRYYRPMEAHPGSYLQAGALATFSTPPPPLQPPPLQPPPLQPQPMQPQPMQPQHNYIWQQSAVRGYYDATGQIKELVMGDQLFKYGGKFADGTVVPTTPVVCNFKAHVYFPYVIKRFGQ